MFHNKQQHSTLELTSFDIMVPTRHMVFQIKQPIKASRSRLSASKKAKGTVRDVGPVKSLAVALQVISEFIDEGEDVSVSSICTKLSLPKSQVSRILATFRANGFLTQNVATKKFRIGLKAYAIGCRYLHSDKIIRESLPVLRSAVDRSGFTATISILDGNRPFYLAGVEGSAFVDFGSRTGTYYPIHATAPGKIFLSFVDQTLRDNILSTLRLNPFTTNTIQSLRELKRAIAETSVVGYAVSRGDRTPGIGSLAVPVFGRDGILLAAMSFVYPLGRVPDDQHSYFVSILHGVARILSLRLGAQSYPFGGNSSVKRTTNETRSATERRL